MKPILTKTCSLPNLQRQERPPDCTAPIWRYQENPIISRNPIPGVARIFNSAVIPYEDAFVGEFRGEPVKRHAPFRETSGYGNRFSVRQRPAQEFP